MAHTEETKRKIGLGNRGKTVSTESRLKMSIAKKGKHVPWNKGIPRTEEVKEKLRKAHIGLKASKETREKMSLKHSGHKHWNWKGGVTEYKRELYQKIEYINWRKEVYKRDNFTCKICGTKNVRLNAHHIHEYAKHPEYRLEISNGITLCVVCHRFIHKMKHKNVIVL